MRWSGNYYHGEMAPLLILDCFEILRHNFLVDRAIDQSVVLSSTKEDHLILRRVFRSWNVEFGRSFCATCRPKVCDSPSGKKEFNRIGTLIKCASNLCYFKTSHLIHFAYLALWIIPTRLTLKVLGFSPGHTNFLFLKFFLFIYF